MKYFQMTSNDRHFASFHTIIYETCNFQAFGRKTRSKYPTQDMNLVPKYFFTFLVLSHPNYAKEEFTFSSTILFLFDEYVALTRGKSYFYQNILKNNSYKISTSQTNNYKTF